MSDTREHVIPAAQAVAGQARLGLRFGLGAFVVNTGDRDGEAVVFVDDAPLPGSVGEKAPNIPAGTEPRLLLAFPTKEQARRVADALVNATPAPAVLSLNASKDMPNCDNVTRLIDHASVPASSASELLVWCRSWLDGLKNYDVPLRSLVLVMETTSGTVHHVAQSLRRSDSPRLIGMLQLCCINVATDADKPILATGKIQP